MLSDLRRMRWRRDPFRNRPPRNRLACLGAAPIFAIMALLTGILSGGQPDILCSAVEDTSPLSGMISMYLLMSGFHTPS